MQRERETLRLILANFRSKDQVRPLQAGLPLSETWRWKDTKRENDNSFKKWAQVWRKQHIRGKSSVWNIFFFFAVAGLSEKSSCTSQWTFAISLRCKIGPHLGKDKPGCGRRANNDIQIFWRTLRASVWLIQNLHFVVFRPCNVEVEPWVFVQWKPGLGIAFEMWQLTAIGQGHLMAECDSVCLENV